MKSVLKTCVCLVVFVLAGPLAGAQDALPSGPELAEGYVTALGGREALEAIETRVAQGDISVGGQRGTIVTYAKLPARIRIEVEFGDGTRLVRVRNGNDLWERHGNGAPVRLSGEMAKVLRVLMTFDALEHQKVFSDTIAEGQETVDDRPCFHVRYEADGIRPMHVWFDQETGLPVKSRIQLPVEGRYLPADSSQGDYRRLDGILVPFETREETPIITTVTTLASVRHNVPIDDALFALPESLK